MLSSMGSPVMMGMPAVEDDDDDDDDSPADAAMLPRGRICHLDLNPRLKGRFRYNAL